jgi:hypothetical protein
MVASTVVAGASAEARMSAPVPSLSSLVLTASDFRSGGAALSQSTSSESGLTLFMRVFKPGGKLSSAPLLAVASLAILEPSAESAVNDYAELTREAQSAAGRNALAREFADQFIKGFTAKARGKVKLTVKRTVVGAPVSLGEQGLRLPMTLKTNLGTFHLALEFGQMERIISIIVLMAQLNGPVSSSDAALAMSLTQKHVRAAFTAASTAPPTIAGSATAGQTLTVDEGTWTGAPSRFDYAWSRCDAIGAACVPIDGATARTYVPTPADVGATLRAAVTGANSVSSLQAASVSTSIVN